jgi:hypothetical protein
MPGDVVSQPVVGNDGWPWARVPDSLWSGALCVAGQAQALDPLAALLRSRRTSAPDIGEVTSLAPGEPARMFPPKARGESGLDLRPILCLF